MPSNPIQLVFHADDFGYNRAFNQGIYEAYSRGLISSTSVRTNGLAFEEAITQFLPKMPHLGFGLHLNLVEGKTSRTDFSTSLLFDREGRYRMSFREFYKQRYDEKLLKDIENDFRFQIETILQRNLALDHLNSHQHTYVIPQIYEIVCKLAAEYKIPFVRLPREKLFWAGRPGFWYASNALKNRAASHFAGSHVASLCKWKVSSNDWFVGLLYTGHMNESTVKKGIDASLADGELIEVLVHPCSQTDVPKDEYFDAASKDYALSSARTTELKTAQSAELKKYLKESRIELTNYRILAGKGGDSSSYFQSRLLSAG